MSFCPGAIRPSMENYSFVAIEQNLVPHKSVDRARQHDAFYVATQGGKLIHSKRMIDPHDILLNDRPFIKIIGDKVGGGSDQFDTARMRLRVRSSTLEAREKGMVDIDNASAQSAA